MANPNVNVNPTRGETVGTTVLSDTLAADRRLQADNIIKNYVILSMTIGMVPIPLYDLLVLIGIQVKMVHSLAKHYGVPFRKEMIKSLITALMSGSMGAAAFVGMGSLAKTFPIVGTLLGGATVSVGAGALTYAVGRVFNQHFEKGGTLLDFQPEKVRELFRREFEAGKGVAGDLKDRAETKVTLP
jgi:uncharacterized protein (DUF697 family)